MAVGLSTSAIYHAAMRRGNSRRQLGVEKTSISLRGAQELQDETGCAVSSENIAGSSKLHTAET